MLMSKGGCGGRWLADSHFWLSNQKKGSAQQAIFGRLPVKRYLTCGKHRPAFTLGLHRMG